MAFTSKCKSGYEYIFIGINQVSLCVYVIKFVQFVFVFRHLCIAAISCTERHETCFMSLTDSYICIF